MAAPKKLIFECLSPGDLGCSWDGTGSSKPWVFAALDVMCCLDPASFPSESEEEEPAAVTQRVPFLLGLFFL